MISLICERVGYSVCIPQSSHQPTTFSSCLVPAVSTIPKVSDPDTMTENEKISWPMIGIDVGTTNSCVAVWHKGRVKIIRNELDNRTTPSVVSFTDYDRHIGEAATNLTSKNLVNTIFDAKRLIGRRFSDATVKQDMKLWPFEVIDGTSLGRIDQPLIVVNYMHREETFTPEEISAIMISKMKGIAEAFLNETVNNAVITVPAHFNNSQRQATIDAGAIAGLNVIRLLNETTAAAIAYSLNTEISNKWGAKKNVLVFDIGGGTLNISLVELRKNGIIVKSTCGDSHLGGTDFDNSMVCDFVEEFNKKHNEDIRTNPRALARLRVASEKAKRILSVRSEADVEIDCLFQDIDFSSTITCAHFEELNSVLFQKCKDAIDQCLKFADIRAIDVHAVVLVGGSSRVPKVKQILKEYFDGIEPSMSIHPDEAVASGAAIHAATLCGIYTKNKDIVVKDFNHLEFGVHYNHYDKHLLRMTPPTSSKASKEYKVCLDYQSRILLEVYEENSDFDFVSRHMISGFSGETGTLSIVVNFETDVNGILDVSAEKDSQSRSKFSITNSNERLLEEDVKDMIEEAKMYRTQEEKRKKLLEAKNDVESNAYTILDQLDDTGNLNNKELERIKEDIGTLLESIQHISNLSHISDFQKRLSDLQNRVHKYLDDKEVSCTTFFSHKFSKQR